MKTKAAILSRINQPLEVLELNLPELKPGQVLVKIAFSGLCHTQLNEIRGLKGEDKYLPHTLGHEGSGVVEATGPGVTRVKAGDHVVLTWIKGSGLDAPSTTYRLDDSSIVNSGAISTFMEHAVISENRIVAIPMEMPLREASLLGCAIPTGAGIVMNTAQVKPGSSVAVFGVGGIGLSAILAASFTGATTIIAVDILEHKLEQSRRVGATHLINARQQDPLAAILEITGKRGVDYAIEAAGRRETMETAFRTVRDNGGLCVLAGNLPHGERITLDPFDLIKGKRIVGTWGGETQPERDIPRYVELFLSQKLKLGELITNSYSLDNINQALTDLEKGKVGRALIDMFVTE
ncbi:MAG: zinc-binding dehydrogenase [Chloroflexi bacterium]|nr:zinc-binding dehydrogenase [Chloroflexota bacterium]